jgi:hypothetical protein
MTTQQQFALYAINGLELLAMIALIFFVTKTGRYWYTLWKVKILSKNRPGTLYAVTEDEEFQAGKQISSHLFPSIELAKAWAMTKQFERSYKRSTYRLLEVNEVSWPDQPQREAPQQEGETSAKEGTDWRQRY